MKKIIFTPFFVLMTFFSFSQQEETLKGEIHFELPYEYNNENEDSIIYDIVGISPKFPGGEEEMTKFIQNNFIYPKEARNRGEQGTIWVEFVVYKDGSIGNIKVVKGVSPTLDKESIRVVSLMPKWIPGEHAGKPVNVRYTIPIKAKLT